MIPKTIHFCWFGHERKPRLTKKCFDSWHRHCAGWEFVEWTEDNYDLAAAPLYVRQAYAAGKWAFVSDYVRLQVVYEHGGVYLDTDVELLKPLDPLLGYTAYFGFQTPYRINTGLGFGAVAGASILKELMEVYEHIPFVKADGKLDQTACPELNTEVFMKRGMRPDDTFQIVPENVALLPVEMLNPFKFRTLTLKKTDNTYSIHWCLGTWLSKWDLMRYYLDVSTVLLKRSLHWFLGDRMYAKTKAQWKRWRGFVRRSR